MSIAAIVTDSLDQSRGRSVLAEYETFIDSIGINPAQRSQRRTAARRFVERHSDPQRWLNERPTPARLLDPHRLKAWPFLTWLIIDRRVRVDLELLLAKPGGVDLGVWWTMANETDVAAPTETAAGLGWSPNWTRQVLGHTAPVLCL